MLQFSTAAWFTNPSPSRKRREVPENKAAVDDEWDKLQNLAASDVNKAKPKAEVDQTAQKDQRSVHCCNSHGSLPFEACGTFHVPPTVQEGRMTHRKSAVFTKQGAPASHMAAARFLDVLPDYQVWQETVSGNTQVRMSEAASWLGVLEKTRPQ